jgi:micrococcal nuclease
LKLLRQSLLTFWVLVLVPSPIHAAEFTAHVVGVSDGDTITVLHGRQQQKVRLNGIDCPERGQPWSKKAKQFTSFMVFGRDVIVREFGRDQYGRLLADVITPEGKSLNHELVREGLAWWYRKRSQDQSLGRLEERAQWGKRGLWADEDPMPPWEWRKARSPVTR